MSNQIANNTNNDINKIKKKEKLTSSYQGKNLILSQDYYDQTKPIKLSNLEYGYNSKGNIIVRGVTPKITPELTNKIQQQFGRYAYIDGNCIRNKKTNRVVGLINKKGDAAFITAQRKKTLSQANIQSHMKQSHEAHVMKQKQIDKKVRKTDNVGKALGTLALTPISMISPSNIVAGVSEASKGNYTKALSKWTGTSDLADIENKGIFEASQGMSKWYDEHPVTGTLVNMGSDLTSAIGIGKSLKNIKEIPEIINSAKTAVTTTKQTAIIKGLERAAAKKDVSTAAQELYGSLSKQSKKAIKTLDNLAQKSTLTENQQQIAEKANEVLKQEVKKFSANQKRLVAQEYIKGGKEELAHKTTALIADIAQNPGKYVNTGLKKAGKFGYNVGKDMAAYHFVTSPAAQWTLDQFNINPKDKAILKEAIAFPTTSLLSRGLDRAIIMGTGKVNNLLDNIGNRIYNGVNEASESLNRTVPTKLNHIGTAIAKAQNKVDDFQHLYSKNTHPLLYTGHFKNDLIGNVSTLPKESLVGMGFGTLEEVNPELSKYAWLFPGIAHQISRRVENGFKYNAYLNSGGAQTADILKQNLRNKTTAYNGMLSVVGKNRIGEGIRAADSDILPKYGGMADVTFAGKTSMPGFNHYATLAAGNKYSNPYLRKVNEAKYIADKLYQPYKGSAWETYRRSKGDAIDIFSPYTLREFNYLLNNSIRLPSQYVAADKTKIPSATGIKGTYTKNTRKINERLNNGLITKEQADEALSTLKNAVVQKFKSYNLSNEYISKIDEIFQKNTSFEAKLSEASALLNKEGAALKNKLIQENKLFGQNNKTFAQRMQEYREAVASGNTEEANKTLEQFLNNISNTPMSLRQYLLSDEYANISNHFTRHGDLIIGKNLNHIGGKSLGNLVYNWKGNRWAPSTFLIKDKNGIYREFGLGSDFGGTGSGGNSEPGNTAFEQFKRALIKNSKYHLDVGAKSIPVVFSPIDVLRTASGRTTTNMVPAFYPNKQPIFNLPLQQKQNFFKNFIFNY